MSSRIEFVLGKGGVGRSTVAMALAVSAARRGERVLVYEWTLADPIARWFAREPAGATPVEVLPSVSVVNYTLESSLRAYFVDHLRLRRFHRHIIESAAVRGLLDAAPGFAELFFLGTLWWLTTLAPRERAWEFDRVIVDAPATGHGASILDMPAELATLPAAGLLAREIDRVRAMMEDSTRTTAVVVSTPEDLAIEESLELLPRVTRALGRAPRVAFVNRAVADALGDGSIAPLRARLPETSRPAIDVMYEELSARARSEARCVELFERRTAEGVVALPDVLLAAGIVEPRGVIEFLSRGALR